MSDLEASQSAQTRGKAKSSGLDRTRLGMLVPLGVIVAVAIVCIVVAALTSAQRADEVAAFRERELLTRAIVNHGEWSLRRLRDLVQSDVSVSAADIDERPTAIQSGLRTWLSPLLDHRFAAIINSSGEIIYSQTGGDRSRPELTSAAVPSLYATLAYVRGQTATVPAGALPLANSSNSRTRKELAGQAFLERIDGRLCVVTAVPLGPSGQARPPIVMTVRTVEQNVLTGIGDRLQLMNLRTIEPGQSTTGDNVYEMVDAAKQPIARFAWTPQRPGAKILESVFPFIGVALAGFTLLAGLVLRYMRYTAATITAAEKRLRHLALHDPLCGLPNRNFFGERLATVMDEVKRGGTPAAVFYIDLDHFKDVNDTLGHPVGDELIRSVTLRLSHALRGNDLVARLGGDEFAVITTAATDASALQHIADRIIAQLCAPYSINGNTIVIGASIGIAMIDRQSGGDAADIMRYADMALYRAKNEGRNRACVYDAVMDADLSKRKLIEQELREAIEGDSLTVLYQPVLNASGETVVGVEALARWPHPVRGVISPVDFIPIAEHSGLIVELGARVLRRACLDGKAWPGISVAVNVSPVQFRQIDFVTMVERILAETGFDAARLELELTESTLLGNVDNAEAAMRRLKTLGVQLALDDFGTGYSSLLYLRRLPFDKLKIDRSFVLSIEKAPDAAAIVHAIVSLGRGLGMKVTAEGVETAEQHLFLRAAGVHCMQGFRFGRPTDPTEIASRLAKPGVYRSIEGDAAAALAS